MKQNKLPLSGSEPTCTCKPFGTKLGIESSNCWQYALQWCKMKEGHKLQPGELSGNESNTNLSSCTAVRRKVLRDLSTVTKGYVEKCDTPCKQGYAKIALVLARNNDYHFLRQNKDVLWKIRPKIDTKESVAKLFRVPVSSVVKTGNGTTFRVKNAGVWSHKRGTAFPPSLVDAKNNIIFDPRKANLSYGFGLDYNKFCDCFCVQQRKPCSPNTKPKEAPRPKWWSD
jgi:hypothetical protein